MNNFDNQWQGQQQGYNPQQNYNQQGYNSNYSQQQYYNNSQQGYGYNPQGQGYNPQWQMQQSYTNVQQSKPLVYLRAFIMTLVNMGFAVLFPISFILLLNVISSAQLNVPGIIFVTVIFAVTISIYIASVKSLSKCVKIGKYTPSDLAKLNLAIRLMCMPVYVLVFIGCFMVFALGPFGIALWAVAFILDVNLLVVTNISVIPCFKSFSRNGVLGSGLTLAMYFCQFIFCVDVFIAITIVAKVRASQAFNYIRNNF